MTETLEEKVNRATTLSIHNRDQIKPDTKCGCYFCLQICNGSDIVEWGDKENDTALCPHCGIDSLMPNTTFPPILEAAHEKWFTGAVPISVIL